MDFMGVDLSKFNKDTYKTLEREYKENKLTQSKFRKGLKCMDIPDEGWFIMNNNATDGYRALLKIAKTTLEAFNLYCDKVIKTINLNNSVDCEYKIKDKYEKLNENGESFNIQIDADYLSLKINECNLTHQIAWAKKAQSDMERDERELIKEQLKEEKQLTQDKERAEREINKLQYEYNKCSNGNSRDKKLKLAELEREINKYDIQLRQTNYALTHGRAGYVYVVSNSDMQKGQYKIGITRRSVEERMRELGSGASHSFGMNVHGYVYSEDCFELEKKLHIYFDKQRVNQINPRKEWFWTTLEDIEKAFLNVDGIEINLIECDDEEWAYSQEVSPFRLI